MISSEVISMEEKEKLEHLPEDSYVPRPKWQIMAARFALVLFLLAVALGYVAIVRGY